MFYFFGCRSEGDWHCCHTGAHPWPEAWNGSHQGVLNHSSFSFSFIAHLQKRPSSYFITVKYLIRAYVFMYVVISFCFSLFFRTSLSLLLLRWQRKSTPSWKLCHSEVSTWPGPLPLWQTDPASLTHAKRLTFNVYFPVKKKIMVYLSVQWCLEVQCRTT